jgi:hypothetical protein
VKAYVALDEKDLRALVRGETVPKLAVNGVEVDVILRDIGWGRIWAAVEDGYATQRRKRDERDHT